MVLKELVKLKQKTYTLTLFPLYVPIVFASSLKQRSKMIISALAMITHKKPM
jgi:hypothetical protein